MNTITNINVEKGINLNTIERTSAKTVTQEEPNTKTSRKDTFEFSDRSQSDSGVYSNPGVAPASTSASGGIYDSANYYSTSIPLSQMAAQRAHISCTSGGSPIINITKPRNGLSGAQTRDASSICAAAAHWPET